MGDREVDQFLGRLLHPPVALIVGGLVDVEHQRKRRLRRIGQEVVLLVHDAHRRVQQIGLVVGQHLAHAVDEGDELAARDEIFVQDVGLVGQRVAQIRHGIVHRIVAADQAGLADPIACARVTVQVSIRCSMCFSESHFSSWNSGPCLERLMVSRRSLMPLTSPSGSRLKSVPSTLV